MRLTLHLLLVTPTTSLLVPSSLLRHHPQRTTLFYKPTSDDENVWTVLANTERWISDTLDKSNKSAREAKKMHFADDNTPDPIKASEKEDGKMDNPYARKEVSYICETSGEACGVVGGIFRRVKEARELGEQHGKDSSGEFSIVTAFCHVTNVMDSVLSRMIKLLSTVLDSLTSLHRMISRHCI
jgi:hypothetical protein